jgi:Flp pilus assembly protein TadG
MKSANGAWPVPLRTRCRARLRRLIRSERGSVTIEFVVVVPLMLLVLLGFTELYLYMRAVSLVEHTAFTLADSIGQTSQLYDDNSTSNPNNLGSLWNAAAQLATPNDLTKKGGVFITSICDQATTCTYPVGTKLNPTMAAGTASISWQRKAPWTAGGMASRVATGSILPSGWPFRNGDSALVVEVLLSYTPFSMTSVFWKTPPGTQTIYERVYVRPRDGTVFLRAAP